MQYPMRFAVDQRTLPWVRRWPAAVLESQAVAALPDPLAELRRKLAAPDAGAPLSDYLRGRTQVVIVVSDHTRAVGYPAFLPALLDAVNRCGIADPQIELLVAVGLHPPQSDEATRRSLGEPVCARVQIAQHHCRDTGELADVQLADGRTVRVNRRLVAGAKGADSATPAVILTGGILFHYHAGFGGGRKAVFPGCAAYNDVLANHRLLLDATGPRGRHPHCQPGRLDGNPIYAESVAVLNACPPMFLVNTVLAGDGAVGQFFCGDPVAAHRVGCDYVHRHFTAEMTAPADLVVASAGGWPKDGSLYQAHKAYDNAARAVRPGGALVFIAGLRDGLGPDAFRSGLDHPTLADHRAALFEQPYSIPSQTCLACREKAARAKTWLVGANPDLHADLRRIGFEPAADVETAVIAARRYLAHDVDTEHTPRTAVIPNAGAVLPLIGGLPAVL